MDPCCFIIVYTNYVVYIKLRSNMNAFVIVYL